MVTWEEVYKNPELMIKHKDDLKNIKIFKEPWYWAFHRHPYLYGEFSDRFDEMDGMDISYALRDDPTLILGLKDHLHKMNGEDVAYTVRCDPALVLDLRDYLHKMGEEHVGMVAHLRPEMSLCMKYRDDVDRIETAYYIGYPRELDNLNREEKREIGKRILEILREEKM